MANVIHVALLCPFLPLVPQMDCLFQLIFDLISPFPVGGH